MKAHERHHLKENEFVATVGRLTAAFRENRDRVLLIAAVVVLIGGVAAGYVFWNRHRDDQAGAMFATAMAVNESPIAPAPTVPGAKQAVGTYPTLRARQEA